MLTIAPTAPLRAGGRTALVLHGEDGPASTADAVEHLGADHRVIAPTHPGWVGTARAASLNSVGALACAYLDLLAAADVVDAVVVGASFGAWVAAEMAVADVEGRVGALVLLDPIGVCVPGRKAPLRTVGGRRAPWAARDDALSAYAGPVAHDPTLVAHLGTVDVPALVVRGGQDKVGADHGRAWADALDRGELVVVDGAGHLPCHRAPGPTFAAIDAFLSPPLTLSARGGVPRPHRLLTGSPA